MIFGLFHCKLGVLGSSINACNILSETDRETNTEGLEPPGFLYHFYIKLNKF